MSLTSAQRKFLKSSAHSLKPVVQFGKNGLTNEVIASIEDALLAHELIKVKFVQFKDEKSELARDISEKANCELVGVLGNIAILFRQHEDLAKRKIDLPKAS